MIAEILCIGTEILIGDIINTNATYISKKMSEQGFDVLYHSVCGDNPIRLENTVRHAFERCDILITTGGLGPTYDDISMEICSKVLGADCYVNNDVEIALRQYFEKTARPMPENNLKQAIVPEGAVVFMNEFGTAPGICLERDGKILVMLPGPPREMRPMLDNQVLKYLEKYSNKKLVSSDVNIFGIGESTVEEKLYDIMVNSHNPTFAPYVNDGEVRVRVSASAESVDKARTLVDDAIKEIKSVLGNYVYGIDAIGLENVLVSILADNNLTLSTAESCTGGLLSGAITAVPGSSSVFGFGVCTYANEAKMKLLGVRQTTLNNFGAVSGETAMEMAKGIRELSDSDIALSLTGIAGPGGGTDEKPVGLVYLGVCTRSKLYAKKLLLARHSTSDREFIRKLAVKNALKTAIDEALELKNDRAF